jgi:acyl-CoA thioester hydrolase
MGVVHHGNYVTWFEVGRTEWMRHKGMSYSEIEDQGLLLPVMDVHVNYKSSAKYDDCVAVFTKIADASPVRLEFAYEVRKISEESFTQGSAKEVAEPFGELLTKGSTMHMWVNTEWKPARINKVAPEVYAIVKKS